MPSLKALGEFKSSFNNIANETNDLKSRKLPFNDLLLPTTEAPLMEFSRPSQEDNFAESETEAGGFDFDALLNSLPGDVNSPSMDDPPSIDDLIPDVGFPSPDATSSFLDDILGNTSSDDFSTPADTFSMPETSAEPDPFAPPAELLSSGSDDFSAGVDDFGLGGLGAENTGADDLGLSGFGTEDTGTDDLGLGGFGTEDTGTDDLGLGDFGAEDSGTDDFGLGGFGAENTGDKNFSSGAPDSDDFGSIDLGGETSLGGFDSHDDLDIDNIPADISAPDTSFSSDDSSDSSLDDLLSSGNEPFSDTGSSDEDVNNILDLSDGIDLGGENRFEEGPLEEEESPSSSEDEDDFLMDSTLPEASDFDSPSDDSGFDSSLPDMGDFDSPSSDMGENSGFDSPLPNTGDDFGFDSPMPDMGDDSGFDSPSSDTGDDFDFDSPSSDMGDDSGFDGSLPDMDFSEMGMGEQQEDPGFDTGAEDNLLSGFGDIGSDFASDSIELENEAEEPVSSFGNDDFALSGLDEILDKSKVPVLSEPEPKRGFFKRKKAAAVEEPEAEDIEEIRLSQQDVDSLLRTLASYPLNLRIVCEELIAEQVLLPQQLSKLIRLLVSGANVRETAEFAEKITGKPIVIPKSFEKMSGAAFEAEQSSFAYIFIHNFLPVLRLFAVITVLALSVFYLGYRFVYIPIKAENLYKRGYERISAGEYQRANQLFNEAFTTHRNKNWFYRYAEAFRDQRRFLLAEEKYDELLRHYPRDKKGVLDYARLNTYYLLNYEKANRLLQQQLLDFSPNDFEGLLAAGDNFLAWADSDPSRFFDRYEDARFSYARLLELNGWRVPIVERMLRYFIRTDNLREVIYLRAWFENDRRRRLSTPSLAELGGYLLDKQLERPSGVPNPFVESIESVRDMLLQAVREDPYLPEPHYHLARYHHNLSNVYEERLTLENAIRAFDLAQTETVRRRLNRVDAHFRYANLLVNNREFFPAEEQLIRGIQLYEDFLSRNLIRATPQLGQLYAAKGDLEYFVKSGDMRAALRDYRLAERYGYSPPEIQYRMGAAFYQLEDWRNALEYLFRASADLPLNRRLLYALGNVTYQRGDYFASQGYFNRLIDILEGQRIRLPVLLPNDNPQFLELGERLMMARNNAGVVYEALAEQTGNREYRSRALGLYAESARAWDSITRDPQTMVRMRLTDSPSAPGINLGFLNANNALRPTPNFSPQIFPRIDRDVLEPSRWEELAPFGGLQ